MISFYYHCYDENIESLVKRIDVKWLEYDVNININFQNDIYLIHLILCINQTRGIYRKSELKEFIWDILSTKCPIDDENSNKKNDYFQQGFYKLFDYCWKQKFSFHVDGKNAKPLYRIVYRKMPLKRKLLDSNISLILGSALFVILCFFIDKWTIENFSWKWEFERIDTHPVAIAIFVLFYMPMALAYCEDKDKAALYVPAVCCLIFILAALVLAIFEPNWMLFDNEWQRFELSPNSISSLEIHFIKRNIYLGLAILLLIPILKFNMERLNDNFIL